jgi:type IV pilus assembly protein PilV
MMNRRIISPQNGFSLVEVMVAVLVISIGLLGIAKMQALALSSTGNSRLRALSAIQAASLASAIRANRDYWSTSATLNNDLTVVVQGNAVAASTDAALLIANLPGCVQGSRCTPTQMAAADLRGWASDLNSLMPNALGTVLCTMPTPTPPLLTSPVTCHIDIAWTENQVAANQVTSAATGTATIPAPKYTLYVQP